MDILGALRRQAWVLIASVILGAVIGLLYLLQAIPIYTSSVSILIDAKSVGISAATPLEGSLTFDSGAIDSQLQILASDKLATAVAKRLDLQNNMAFLDAEKSPLQRAISTVMEAISAALRKATKRPAPTPIQDLPEELRLLVAATTLQNNLTVSRIGRTYVFLLSFRNPDRLLAQSIAGQYASAYLEDQLDAKFVSTRRAANWMQERARELKAQSLAADEAVQHHRTEHNLLTASGQLVEDQALTESLSQLTNARGVLDSASARYQRLKEIVDSGNIEATLTEAYQNPNISDLRSRYLAASKKQAEISERLGPTHLAAVKARGDMSTYKQQIFSELANLLPALESEVSISKARVKSIEETIEEFRKTRTSNDSAMAKLRSLEQEANSLKELYANILQKTQELQQQQSFPVTDARIISNATYPARASSPQKVLVMAASLFLGGVFGLGISTLREWNDRGFRTSAQVREELEIDFITNIPTETVKRRKSARRATAPRKPNSTANAPAQDNIFTLTDDQLFQKAIDEPFSQFAEAIRTLRSKVATEFPKPDGIVIGIVSVLPNEGKSTIAKNLASSLALLETRTLLIDGDLRNPSLTKGLSRPNRPGLIDIALEKATLSQTLLLEKETGLQFLPLGNRKRMSHDLFGGRRSHNVLNLLRRQFDVIVIDFPPVGALTDALATSSAIDGYLFVTQWGKTPRTVVRSFLQNNPEVAEKTMGLALNMVDLKDLARYDYYYRQSKYPQYNEKYFKETI